MIRDVMIHMKETLNADERRELLHKLDELLGLGLHAHQSEKPHLIFVPTDPDQAPPHTVLKAICDQGYQATLVDL